MPRRGSWDMRNAGHKKARARQLAEATADDEALAEAFAWFRSSAALLVRRRPPRGVSKEAHRVQAARLKREAAADLKARAQAIDRGDYDAKG
jgi:hypothetical protein